MRPTIRYLVGMVVRSAGFDRLLLAFILLSTALLAYQTYPAAVGTTNDVLNLLNLVCT